MMTTIFEQPGSYAPSVIDEAPEETSSREKATGVQYGILVRPMGARRSKAARLSASIAFSAVLALSATLVDSTLISHKAAAQQESADLAQASAHGGIGASSVLDASWVAADGHGHGPAIDPATDPVGAQLEGLANILAAFSRGEAPPPDAELDALAAEIAKKDRFASPAPGWAEQIARDVIDADD